MFVGLDDIAGSGLQRSVSGYVFPVAGFTVGSCFTVIVADDKEGIVVHLHICPVHIERKRDKLPVLSFQIQLVDDTIGTHGSGLAEQVRINGLAVGPIIVVISTKSVALGVLLHGECIGASDGQLAVIKYRYSWIVFEADVCRYNQFAGHVDEVCFIIQRIDCRKCIPTWGQFIAVYGPERHQEFCIGFIYTIENIIVVF